MARGRYSRVSHVFWCGRVGGTKGYHRGRHGTPGQVGKMGSDAPSPIPHPKTRSKQFSGGPTKCFLDQMICGLCQNAHGTLPPTHWESILRGHDTHSTLQLKYTTATRHNKTPQPKGAWHIAGSRRQKGRQPILPNHISSGRWSRLWAYQGVIHSHTQLHRQAGWCSFQKAVTIKREGRLVPMA